MKLNKLIKKFEKLNNICIYVICFGDGSSAVHEFWTDDLLKEYDSKKQLKKFLKKSLEVRTFNANDVSLFQKELDRLGSKECALLHQKLIL
jgi:hypothetical protein